MTRPPDIETALELCLARLEAGDAPEACLRDFPEYAAELDPLLAVAVQLRVWEPPRQSAGAESALLGRAQAALRRQHIAPAAVAASWFRRPVAKRALRLAFWLVLVFGSLGGGVGAAQASLPGDMLYGLKRASEEVRIQVATSPDRVVTLCLSFAGRRVDEVLRMEALGRPVPPQVIADLQQKYERAWLAIDAAPDPSELRARYTREVRQQAQTLADAIDRTTNPDQLQVLRQAGAVNADAAARLQQPSPETPVRPTTSGDSATMTVAPASTAVLTMTTRPTPRPATVAAPTTLLEPLVTVTPNTTDPVTPTDTPSPTNSGVPMATASPSLSTPALEQATAPLVTRTPARSVTSIPTPEGMTELTPTELPTTPDRDTGD